MRWWVIGLLVANIAYFAWEYDRQLLERRAEPPAMSPIPAGVEPLKLVSELEAPPQLREDEAEPASQPSQGIADPEGVAPPSQAVVTPSPALAASETPAVPASAPPVTVCFQVGPFTSEGDAAWAQKWLENRQMQTRRRTEEKSEAKGFWVYLEPQPSQQAAQQKVKDLKRKGIQDYFLISGGEMRNAISLGVYKSQDSANRRLAELKEKGYQPLVIPRGMVKSIYWVDAWGEQDRETFLSEAKKRLPRKVAESNTCGEIAMKRTNP